MISNVYISVLCKKSIVATGVCKGSKVWQGSYYQAVSRNQSPWSKGSTYYIKIILKWIKPAYVFMGFQ